MNKWQILISILALGTSALVLFVLIRLSRRERKISYKELLEQENRQYLIKNNRFIGWMVGITFVSVFSVFYLIRITLISVPALILILLLLSVTNLYFFRRKYKISDKKDLVFLSVVIGIGQLALLLWLNFISVSEHAEAYKITGKSENKWANLTTIYLEDDAFSTYWNVRSFETANAPEGDSIVFKFKDGLVGFRVYEGCFSK
ncbi:MAG: hypothetical protein ACK452_17305 [Bacteroidota bacterium]|jgi:hypothetical protein